MDFRGCLPEALPREYEGPRHIVKVGQRHILLAVTLTGLTFAQQPKTPATVAKITSTAVEASSAAEEGLAFERSLDAAFVRGMWPTSIEPADPTLRLRMVTAGSTAASLCRWTIRRAF